MLDRRAPLHAQREARSWLPYRVRFAALQLSEVLGDEARARRVYVEHRMQKHPFPLELSPACRNYKTTNRCIESRADYGESRCHNDISEAGSIQRGITAAAYGKSDVAGRSKARSRGATHGSP